MSNRHPLKLMGRNLAVSTESAVNCKCIPALLDVRTSICENRMEWTCHEHGGAVLVIGQGLGPEQDAQGGKALLEALLLSVEERGQRAKIAALAQSGHQAHVGLAQLAVQLRMLDLAPAEQASVIPPAGLRLQRTINGLPVLLQQ